ncbi:MAG: RNA polymerase factor sigma-32 [Myxococcota bacterium]|jgi:RNA polymerase sigma-32 factor
MRNIAPYSGGVPAPYIKDLSRYPLLTPEEERELARRYRDTGDVEAARKLVTSNLRFVVKIANEYQRYGVKLPDLIQEGNIGLMKAVKKFDPDRGYRFISYAVWWIRAYIQAFILKSWSLVKIGTTESERRLFFSLEKAKKELARLDGEKAEPLRLTDGTKREEPDPSFSAEQVEDMDRRIHGRDLSIDTPISQDTSETFLDRTADPSANFQDDVINREEGEKLQSAIKKTLDNLPTRERYIIENRVMADEPMTLEEIGKTFGVTRERARQIEAKAISMMKSAMEEFKPDNG